MLFMRSSIRNVGLVDNTLVDIPPDELATIPDEFETESNELVTFSDELVTLSDELVTLSDETHDFSEDLPEDLPEELRYEFQNELRDNPSTLFILRFRGNTYYYLSEEPVRKKLVLSKNQVDSLEKCVSLIQCPICMEETNKNIKLPCNHVFCTACIEKWLCKNTNTCPNCRINVIA